ncbi:cytochrome b/b6 domain-containing protein [Novosphingobium bradum]|uniref:Cytochrome b/b6 domain-containing protein n=1 Tax=Novosphingobium bradum TaxID=1737444 RepID=A0ABV7IX75_9SPHN
MQSAAASRSAEALPDAPPAPRGGDRVRRHRLSTRLWHWTNLVVLTIMLMSGLMIFNAHPRLYWGAYGANPDRAWLEVTAENGRGSLRIGTHAFDTSGLIGTATDAHGAVQAQAFPGWMTIPSTYSLADARLWHLAFAWLLAPALLLYLLWSLANGHLRRDLHITRAEWSPRHLWHDVAAHARLRFPTGAAALRYNVLQKLAYCGVLFGLIPLAIFTGLTMSPAMNAAVPGLLDLFGGRQSARSLHFLAALGLVLFVVVHLVMVVLAGPINEVRSMLTGWYRLPPDRTGTGDHG